MKATDQGSEQIFYNDGLRFECNRCSHCCRHEPGYVFLAEEDMERIPRYLTISSSAFRARYCREVDLGFLKRLSLDERPNYDCVFWSVNGCEIYEVRPLQCRSYPFWPAILDSAESWSQEAQSCPGMNVGRLHSAKSIAEWLFLARRQRLIELNPPYKGG